VNTVSSAEANLDGAFSLLNSGGVSRFNELICLIALNTKEQSPIKFFVVLQDYVAISCNI